MPHITRLHNPFPQRIERNPPGSGTKKTGNTLRMGNVWEEGTGKSPEQSPPDS